MNFNRHFNLEGKHAFLSPSSYHWINYSEDKLDERYLTAMAAQRGSELHEFAEHAIRLGVKVLEDGSTLSLFVNDAIDMGMSPEQVLFYSENCFGTADAIAFSNNHLQIHDLKTGITKTSEHQLEVYAALFCLEYGHSPFDISMELRIYQSDEVRVYDKVNPGDIAHIIDTIIQFDKRIEMLKGRLEP